MTEKTQSPPVGHSPQSAEEDALARVVADESFEASPRLQAFLTYVVTETLNGRGDRIKGKTIAEDVYDRPGAEEDGNLVRVDARRLRTYLANYYAGPGAEDPVRIHMDKGGYAPRFEHATEKPPVATRKVANRRSIGLIVFIAGFIAVSGWIYFDREQPRPRLPGVSTAEREAILSKSAASLQAVNLTEQAHGMLLPLFDVSRLHMVTGMFRQAIALDAYYSGGFSGASFTLATLYLLPTGDPSRQQYLEEARRFSEKALNLDPANPWSQLAAAWVAFAERDFDTAEVYADRALALSPHDGNILDYAAIIALFSERYEDALALVDPNRERLAALQRFGDRNIRAAAQFHSGNFQKAVDELETASRTGDPVSPPSLAYLGAAYVALDREDDAREVVRNIETSWPGFPLDKLLSRFHRSPRAAAEVMDRLKSVGWSATDG